MELRRPPPPGGSSGPGDTLTTLAGCASGTQTGAILAVGEGLSAHPLATGASVLAASDKGAQGTTGLEPLHVSHHLGDWDVAQGCPYWSASVQEGMGEDGFGESLSAAGDVDGDGTTDLLVGSPNYDDTSKDGRAYLFYGPIDGAFNGERVLFEGSSQAEAGAAVEILPDLNGDGHAEMLVSAPGTNDDAGAVYLLRGKASRAGGTLAGDARVTFVGTDRARLGASVAFVGDVNGDGFGDLLLGAPNDRATPEDPRNGAVYLIYGSEGLWTGEEAQVIDVRDPGTETIVRISGEDSVVEFGAVVSGLGDFDRDGFDDLLFSAYKAGAPGAAIAGVAYVVYGRAAALPATRITHLMDGGEGVETLEGSDGFRVQGELQADALGISLAPAGDTNGDGYPDVLLGSGRGANDTAGMAYLIFGGAAGCVGE